MDTPAATERLKDESYTTKAIGLFTGVVKLFDERAVPQAMENFSGSYRKYELTDHELSEVATMFNGNVLDAPQSIRITVCLPDQTRAVDTESVMFITTDHDEVHIEYILWLNDNDPSDVKFTKDVVRIYDSPTPYRVGHFTSPAVIHDRVSDQEKLEENELNALKSLVAYLGQSIPE